MPCRGIRVFSYHGVTADTNRSFLERNLHTVKDFQEHTTFLRRFRILNLDELGGVLKGELNITNGAIITFDDGYENNLLAGEILRKNGLPAVFFVTSGMLGTGGCIWTVELSLLMLSDDPRPVEIFKRKWERGSPEQRESAFRFVRGKMKFLPSVEKDLHMDALRSQFPDDETIRLLEKYPSLKIMSWDQAAGLAAAGFEIGSHGVWHEIHHENQPESVIREELFLSKKMIEDRIGKPVRSFAYPNGDFCDASIKIAQQMGYTSCFTTRQSCAGREVSPYAVPRIEPQNSIRSFVSRFYWIY